MSELCQKRLFVGKVPENATDNEISDIFSQFGVIDDIKRNPSRRYCFIEMSTVAEANAVVKYSGLLQLKGNILNVSLAKKKTDMPNHKGDEGQSQRASNQSSVQSDYHQSRNLPSLFDLPPPPPPHTSYQQLQPQSSAQGYGKNQRLWNMDETGGERAAKYLKSAEEQKPNDVEIVCIDKARELVHYAESIEESLKDKGLRVDILYPNADVKLEKLMGNLALRKTMFAIGVHSESRMLKCVSVYVLHGEQQEHKNMPEREAIQYICRNHARFNKQDLGSVVSERPHFSIPKDVKNVFASFLDDKSLGISEYDKILKYLAELRESYLKNEYETFVEPHLILPPGANKKKEPVLREKQEEIQSYVLEILNKNPSILTQTIDVTKL